MRCVHMCVRADVRALRVCVRPCVRACVFVCVSHRELGYRWALFVCLLGCPLTTFKLRSAARRTPVKNEFAISLKNIVLSEKGGALS